MDPEEAWCVIKAYKKANSISDDAPNNAYNKLYELYGEPSRSIKHKSNAKVIG